MSPPPLLLDLDGTLVDSLADIAASANHVRAVFDLPPVPVEAVRAMIGDGAVALLERALADADRPVEAARAWPIYDAHHRQQCTLLVRPYPGVVETLQRWREEERPVAVVTNKPERFARSILEHLGLDALVGALVGGDTTPARKPAPEPLLEALRRLGQGPERAWMAGDGIQDLRAGKAAGLRTIGALYGFQDAERLRAEGADLFWSAFGRSA
jgi:phosphoglycolate phosphatase